MNKEGAYSTCNFWNTFNDCNYKTLLTKSEYSFFLKLFRGVMFFKSLGNLFHKIEPEKDKLVLKRSNLGWGTISFLELYLLDAFVMISVRYVGVWLLYILCISIVLFRSNCFLSGSILSFLSFSSVAVVWQLFICFTARLWSAFNFFNVSWLQPSQIVEA